MLTKCVIQNGSEKICLQYIISKFRKTLNLKKKQCELKENDWMRSKGSYLHEVQTTAMAFSNDSFQKQNKSNHTRPWENFDEVFYMQFGN